MKKSSSLSDDRRRSAGRTSLPRFKLESKDVRAAGERDRTETSTVTMDEQPTTNPQPESLVIDDDDRYSRLRLITWWRQEKLQAAKVLVVGAGALGNEVLKNLALLGLGTTYLIDLDQVELSNLSRSVLFREQDGGQPKAACRGPRAVDLNPEITIFPLHGDVITDIGLGLFAEIDLVIGCLDNREARLWVNRQCWKTNTPWIDAGIQEIQGVVKVFVPPDSACYECAMTKRDYELLNFRYSCPLLTRDQITSGKVPTAPTIASMMAALQVQEALKLLHGMPVAAGSALVFTMVWPTSSIRRVCRFVMTALAMKPIPSLSRLSSAARARSGASRRRPAARARAAQSGA